jgi:Asp-tRNA(Asn)/Glu-tRNA(Gln) amidotransferase A subunit family amidase
MIPHVNGYSDIGYGYYFSYPFCKYPWISNATRTRTRGYRLIPESMPNGFFTRGHTDNGYPLPSLAAPDSSATSVFALDGLPNIAVPAGYDEQDVPFSISFAGLKGYDPRLIEIAFEQATKVRKPPTFISVFVRCEKHYCEL